MAAGVNWKYAEGCQEDGTSVHRPDCGHNTCGLLCDVHMAANRPDGFISEAVSKYQRGEAQRRRGGKAGITTLLRSGLTIPEAARKLGTSPEDIVSQLTNGRERVPTAAYLEAERLLRVGGLSFGEVAECAGLTDRPRPRDTVRQLANALGLKSAVARDGRKYTPAHRAQVLSLFESGLTRRQIAVQTNVHISTIKVWLRATHAAA